MTARLLIIACWLASSNR